MNARFMARAAAKQAKAARAAKRQEAGA